MEACEAGCVVTRFEQPVSSGWSRSENVNYSRHMIEILTTEDFDKWLRKLKDRVGRLRILERIDRLANGNPGDSSQSVRASRSSD